jgi:hypothetical protein
MMKKPTSLARMGYIWPWAQATFENWQSEFLQLFAFVALTTFLIHKGSPESKDSDEQMQASLAGGAVAERVGQGAAEKPSRAGTERCSPALTLNPSFPASGETD